MNKKNLLKIADISGWLLLLIIIFYFISGYAMVHEYGFDRLMHKKSAWALHKYMTVPFLIILIAHIVPYYIVRKQVKKLLIISGIIFTLSAVSVFAVDKILNAEAKPHSKSEQTKKEDKTVQCKNCQNECIIKQGEKGHCKKFENINGKLQPVEKN